MYLVSSGDRSRRGQIVPMGFSRPPNLDACDHYHHYREDVQLIAALGVKQYRFSLSWCRIIPEGRGAVNSAGFEFYERLLDCLEAYGIEPVVTLFHWDSPDRLGASLWVLAQRRNGR